MTPYYPVEACPTCDNPRPYHHACPCGDPGGMPRTLPDRWPKWTKTERHLYAGQAVRVLGETDYAGNLLCEFMSGPLKGECRWMSDAELFSNATQDAEISPHATDGGAHDRKDLNGHPDAGEREIIARQVEGDAA